jgi:N-acetylneuraminic acid mutarotase
MGVPSNQEPAMIGKTNWIGKAVLLFGVMASLAGALQSDAQSGDWTWTDGSSTVGSDCVSTYPCGRPGVYGTKGTLASGNLPGSRIEPVSWTDTSGNKWLFGGFGYDGNGALGEMNDLWQTNSSGNAWGWISGANGAGHSGVYGTLGTASASNVPGGRQGAVSWTDKAGNLWLFGGFGYDGNATSNYGYENDLWMYNLTTKQWTWESGSSTVPAPQSTIYGTQIGVSSGVYGTMGTPASGNTPGGRTNATTWVDSSGNLWLFGGGFVDEYGYEEVYNDLWEFNTATQRWTWVGGSTSGGATDQTGVYGTLGTPASGNFPGSRYLASSWTDSSGNFWLFGGSGYASNAGQYNLNDLWKFSTSSGQWTWMGGASVLYPCNFLFSTPCPVPGTYGTLGSAASTNFPGARSSGLTWTDSSGNLWLFGGSGQDANNEGAWLNDLWEYDPGTTYWTWMGGSSTIPTSCATGNCGQPGVYGTLGTAATANVPGARVFAVAWTDQSGDFWLFGGQGEDSSSATGYLNDMWEYQPSSASSSPAAATPTFSVAGGTYSTAQTVTLSDSTSGATIYYTTNGTTPTTSSSLYSSAINVSSTETLEAIAVASGYTNSTVATAAYTITTQAATPTFSVAGGSYSSAQTVTLSDSTSGATIYYTTNGTTPTTSSAVYSSAINVSSTETLEAIAVASGYTNSAVATAAYTITQPTTATPTFSVAGGTYSAAQTVTLSDSTSGATIYYTTNGTTPTTSSSLYSSAITVSSTETLEAIAVASGYTNSAVATAAYTITTQAATPTFSVAGGSYSSAQTVTLSDSTSGATIYYTTNGTTPTTSSSVYSSAITVSTTETLEAIAVASGYTNSAVATAAYTITTQAATPTFSVAGGTYSTTQTVTLSDSTSGATIYYTTKRHDPNHQLGGVQQCDHGLFNGDA